MFRHYKEDAILGTRCIIMGSSEQLASLELLACNLQHGLTVGGDGEHHHHHHHHHHNHHNHHHNIISNIIINIPDLKVGESAQNENKKSV